MLTNILVLLNITNVIISFYAAFVNTFLQVFLFFCVTISCAALFRFYLHHNLLYLLGRRFA